MEDFIKEHMSGISAITFVAFRYSPLNKTFTLSMLHEDDVLAFEGTTFTNCKERFYEWVEKKTEEERIATERARDEQDDSSEDDTESDDDL